MFKELEALVVVRQQQQKDTLAIDLAENKQAVLFSLDRLILKLFPEEDNFKTHRKYVQRVENVFFPIARDLLRQGCSVVMDFPGHTKQERDRLRQIAIQADAKIQLYYLPANLQTITERVQKRNTELKSGEYFIPDWLLNTIIDKFEPPDNSEHPIKIESKW